MSLDTQLGLTSAEVAERIAGGAVNKVEERSSRSLASILRANIFTRFNAILATMLVLILVFGKVQDALFGIVLVVNSLIGIIQEIRAKRTLDRLTVLSAPRATVIRDGADTEIALEEIVIDDVIRIATGDQIGVDCEVLEATGLEIDESLLTGEADPVDKTRGDDALSGSFVVAGAGLVRASRIGKDAYAYRLAAEAKKFTLASSELRDGINRILRFVTWLLIPTAILLFASQIVRTDHSFGDGVSGAVAGVVAMVPEGLVLLASLALAVAVIRLGHKNVLVQELPAVETLARVDVICLDKTGTLTAGAIVYDATEDVRNSDSAELDGASALAALAASVDNPNASLEAIGAAFGDRPDWSLTRSIPFSSARKYSAATFAESGTWILGAPEIVMPTTPPPELEERARELAATGRRVMLLAHSNDELGDAELPAERVPVMLVMLVEEVRPDAADTIDYFLDQNVTPKVISGDNPTTVSTIARRVHVPNADRAVDARELADDESSLADALESNGVFGRVTPHQKQAMVGALQSRDHTVAMTGDGVNDVLALKDADIGIAMGSGSAATKSVAQLILLDGRFSTLPSVVAEGRRVIANIERVAVLFVTKTVYATLLALSVGVLGWPFPFLPRHLSLIGSLTIGIPAFILSFTPTSQRARPGFIGRVLRFSLPAGIVAGVATFGVYAIARTIGHDSLADSRTAATIVLFCVAIWVLIIVAAPLNTWRLGLVAAMTVAFGLAFVIPFTRHFFELEILPLDVWFELIAVAAGAIVVLEIYRRFAAFSKTLRES